VNPVDRIAAVLEQLAAVGRRQEELLLKLQADVGRAVRVHLEDRVGARSWAVNAGDSFLPGETKVLLSFTPPQNYPWRLKELGLCADRWDDPAGTRGMSYTLRRGGAAAPNLANLSFPWGTLEDRGDVYLVGNGAELFELVGTNNDAVDTLDLTAVAVGVCYSVEYGGA
jgi:hypothetical protein